MGEISGIPAIADEWLEGKIGPFRICQALRSNGGRTGVWHVRSEMGEFAFKINRRRIRWGTELYAYHNWGSAFGSYLPDLVDVLRQDEVYGLLLRWVHAIPLRETNLSSDQEEHAYKTAGMLLRRLHDHATGTWCGPMFEDGQPSTFAGEAISAPPATTVEWVRNFILPFVEKADSLKCLTESECRLVRRALDATGAFAREKPVSTATDYTPGNWLVTADGRFAAVIDLENVLWGTRMDPYARLLLDYFPPRPSAEQAFHEGYGMNLPEAEPEQALAICMIHAIPTVIRGVEFANAKLIERGHAAFEITARMFG